MLLLMLCDILYATKGKIYPTYVLKFNSNSEKTAYSFNDSK